MDRAVGVTKHLSGSCQTVKGPEHSHSFSGPWQALRPVSVPQWVFNNYLLVEKDEFHQSSPQWEETKLCGLKSYRGPFLLATECWLGLGPTLQIYICRIATVSCISSRNYVFHLFLHLELLRYSLFQCWRFINAWEMVNSLYPPGIHILVPANLNSSNYVTSIKASLQERLSPCAVRDYHWCFITEGNTASDNSHY